MRTNGRGITSQLWLHRVLLSALHGPTDGSAARVTPWRQEGTTSRLRRHSVRGEMSVPFGHTMVPASWSTRKRLNNA